METSIDQDQQWLLNCLTATLDPNHQVRSFAETSFNQASLQSGFGCALSKVAANRELLMGLRQLAAVLLKQYIKKHWKEDEENFELPLICNDEKIYDKSLRSKALSVVYSCTSMLGVMSGVYQTETSGLMRPMLKPWMDQFSTILQAPVQPNDPDDWSLRMEVLKCLNQFVLNFRSLAKTEFMIIVGPLWQTFVSSLRVYEVSAVQGKEDTCEDMYDSDGSDKSLESFVMQLFGFLLTIVGSARLLEVHQWSLDANQYVADEDDNSYSCRVSGALLLEEVISQLGGKGISAVIDSAKKCFSNSQQEKAAGSTTWWRISTFNS